MGRPGTGYSCSPETRSEHGVGHAFANTLLFLDWDRRGFPYPVVPISVNAYGRRVIGYQGGILEREAPLRHEQARQGEPEDSEEGMNIEIDSGGPENVFQRPQQFQRTHGHLIEW